MHRPRPVRPHQRARHARHDTDKGAADRRRRSRRRPQDRGTPPVRRRNTEWRAATETRTAHLKALLGRKAPPAGALTLIAEAMARGETQPQMSSFGHQTACELLGLPGNGAGAGYRDLLLAELARASEKRTQVIALAMLGAAEHGVRDVQTWQSAEGSYWASYGVPLARYLAWLAEHTGYTLSDIEAEVAAHATRPGRRQPQRTGRPARAGQMATAIPPPTPARASRSATAPARNRPRHPPKPAKPPQFSSARVSGRTLVPGRRRVAVNGWDYRVRSVRPVCDGGSGDTPGRPVHGHDDIRRGPVTTASRPVTPGGSSC